MPCCTPPGPTIAVLLSPVRARSASTPPRAPAASRAHAAAVVEQPHERLDGGAAVIALPHAELS